MNSGCEHPIKQPLLVTLRAIGAISPDLGAGVIGAHDVAKETPIRGRCRSDRHLPDEAITSVDADMRFVAEDRQGNHGQRRAVLAMTHLAADLERPARIGVLLRGLVRLVWPNLLRALARLDRLAFALGIALLRRGYQRGIVSGA